MRGGMALHHPIMVKTAADVDTAVFDKTGTLTDTVVCTGKANSHTTWHCQVAYNLILTHTAPVCGCCA